MYLFLYLFLSFLPAQDLTLSSHTLIFDSFYDISYLEKVSSIFLAGEIEKATDTLNLLISIKNKDYTRSDIYAFLSCVSEKGISLKDASYKLTSKKRLVDFFIKMGCSYIDSKNKAYDFIKKNRVVQKENDLKLLNRIIWSYFKE